MQPKLTRRAFLAGACAVGAATLCGCAGHTASPSEAISSSSAAATHAANEITATLSYSGADCNPIGNSNALFLAAGWHVFEGLYGMDLHDYSTYPALAEGDPKKLDDVTYEVTLREGAKFSNGADVAAADIVNAFERNLANDTYSALLPFLSSGSVTAKDDRTVQLKLNYPFSNLLKGRLSLVKAFPASMTDDELSSMPIGTGPWKYERIDGSNGGSIAFLPNEHYNGPEPATCERMTWQVQTKGTLRANNLIEGSSLAIEGAPISSEVQLASLGATVEDMPSFSLPFLMFNCAKEPLSDYRVRQALLYAIDTEKLIAEALDGRAAAATSFLPESYAGYHRASTVYSYDPERARALLASAGQEALSLEMRVNDNWVLGLAAPIIENWQAIGLSVTSRQAQTAELFSDLGPEAAQAGTLPFDVILSPGDPSCFGNDTDLLLSWWYDSPLWMQGRTCWASTPECQKLQALLQQARESSDSITQQQIWNRCFDIVAEQAPLYPLLHREVSTAYMGDQLEGFAPIATSGLLFLGTTPLE